eukprot:7387038-Prymnesium_polylepis.3
MRTGGDRCHSVTSTLCDADAGCSVVAPGSPSIHTCTRGSRDCHHHLRVQVHAHVQVHLQVRVHDDPRAWSM